MDRYDPVAMKDDMWYDQSVAMDIGRQKMLNQTMDVGHAQALYNRTDLKRWLPRLSYLTLILLALFLWRFAAGPEWFPIRNVKVEGAFVQVSRTDIKDIVMPYVQDGYFHFNSYGLKEAAMANSWVAEAVVKRQWPAGISLTIREHQPLVRWQHTGLISQRGHIFFPPQSQSTSWESLPKLSGPEEYWRDVYTMYQQLNALALAHQFTVTAVHTSDRQAWQVKLNQQIQVILGRDNPVMNFKRFLQAYAAMPAGERARLTSYDMRYPNGMAAK